MRQINIYTVLGVVILCVFCLSLSGWAQLPPEGAQPEGAPLPGGDTDDNEIRVNWERLGLSQEQIEQVQQKQREFQISIAGPRQELMFAKKDLQAELVKDPVDRGKIDSLLEDISALNRQITDAWIQNMLAIKSILTQEQIEKLAELQSQLPAEFKRLNLTAERRTQIREIIKSSVQQNREIAEELRELKMQLRETLLAQDVDTEKLSQLQADIAEKEFAQGKARVDMLLQIKEILTPEQQKLLQRVRERRERNVPAKTRKR